MNQERIPKKVDLSCNKDHAGGISSDSIQGLNQKIDMEIAKMKVEYCERINGPGTCDCPLKLYAKKGQLPNLQ